MAEISDESEKGQTTHKEDSNDPLVTERDHAAEIPNVERKDFADSKLLEVSEMSTPPLTQATPKAHENVNERKIEEPARDGQPLITASRSESSSSSDSSISNSETPNS